MGGATRVQRKVEFCTVSSMQRVGHLFLALSAASALGFTEKPSQSCGPKDHADDCNALCELWSASTTRLLGWCNGSALCNWSGINCTDGRVVQIMIPHTNQSGRIPESIGKLSQLQYLLIGNNPYTGTIPSSIGQLTNLKSIGLDRTQLTGSIPQSFSNLTNLEQFVAFGNKFSRALPRFGELTKLSSLGLFSDGLTSWTDTGICELVKNGTLTECGLSGNPFVCPIPSCAAACGATCGSSVAIV